MYLGKIEAAEEIQLLARGDRPEPEGQGRGGALLGIAFLFVALPYWGLRLFANALWRDVKRAGRAVKLAGSAYGEEFMRNRDEGVARRH